MFELKFSWKLSEAKCAGSLGTLKKQIVLNICDCFKKMSKAISHIERTVNVLGEDPTCTKIRITNAGKDKQKSFEARLESVLDKSKVTYLVTLWYFIHLIGQI